MFTVRSNFIWVFKTGDNINHNLRILAFLYEQYAIGSAENQRLLCKVIIVFIASIIEALLHDFHVRCTQSVREKIDNIAYRADGSTFAERKSMNLKST